MKGPVLTFGLLCGCRQVLGFDDVVGPSPSIDAPVGTDAPDVDAPLPVGTARRIDVVGAKVKGGPHADFPLLISISDGDLRATTSGGTVASDSGFDIVFTADQVGTSRLAHEIDAYDPVNGTLVAWVKIPSLATDSSLFVHYGDPMVTTTQEDPPAVWSAGFAGVWHLTTLGDSTGQSTATEVNTPVVVGKIGGARQFNGADSHIDVAASPAIADVFGAGGTIEAWVNPRSAGENSLGRIADKSPTFLLGRGDTLVNNSLLFSEGFSTTPGNWRSPQGSFQKDRLIHVAATYDASSAANVPRMFIDGVETTPSNEDPAGTVPSDASFPLVIGNRGSGDRAFDGIIDELKLSRTLRSPDWIATEFANQHEPDTFVTLSAPL